MNHTTIKDSFAFYLVRLQSAVHLPYAYLTMHMRSISPSLLYLLLSLAEVQSQTGYPYISFMGNILSNHSYVNLSLVGNVLRENFNPLPDKNNNTVECHTDLVTCCRRQTNNISGRGDCFFPNSTVLKFPSSRHDIYEDRRTQVVLLQRRRNVYGPSGVYRCVIPTIDVEDVNNASVGETVYVGLYGSGGGDIAIPGGMTLSVDLNGASPQFTLTCISTGGPATTVTWTKDSVTVTEGNETVLDNHTTSQYTHTLTVTGRLGGLYTCSVANNKPSKKIVDFTVQVASPPTNLMVVREGPTSVRVSWNPLTPLGDTSGYRIYYSGGSIGSVDVSDSSTDNYLLTGLQNGYGYTISIVATSEHFHSIGVRIGLPTVTVTSTTPTSISLSWSIPRGSVVTSYEVTWQVLSSGDADGRSGTSDSITSTSYTMEQLESNTIFNITVTATNADGIAINSPIIMNTVIECSQSDSVNTVAIAVAGGVTAVLIITTAVTVIVIVVLVLRRKNRRHYSSDGAQRDLDDICTSGNEAYHAVTTKTDSEEGGTDPDYEAPRGPSLPPSSSEPTC